MFYDILVYWLSLIIFPDFVFLVFVGNSITWEKVLLKLNENLKLKNYNIRFWPLPKVFLQD